MFAYLCSQLLPQRRQQVRRVQRCRIDVPQTVGAVCALRRGSGRSMSGCIKRCITSSSISYPLSLVSLTTAGGTCADQQQQTQHVAIHLAASPQRPIRRRVRRKVRPNAQHTPRDVRIRLRQEGDAPRDGWIMEPQQGEAMLLR
jgi:hypothetical protein